MLYILSGFIHLVSISILIVLLDQHQSFCFSFIFLPVLFLIAILFCAYHLLFQAQLFLVLHCWNDEQLGHNFHEHISLYFIDDTSLPVAAYGELASRDGTFNCSSQTLLTNDSFSPISKFFRIIWLLTFNENQTFLWSWGHHTSLKSNGLFTPI